MDTNTEQLKFHHACDDRERGLGISKPIHEILRGQSAIREHYILDVATSPADRLFTGLKPDWQAGQSDLKVSSEKALTDWRNHAVFDSSTKRTELCFAFSRAEPGSVMHNVFGRRCGTCGMSLGLAEHDECSLCAVKNRTFSAVACKGCGGSLESSNLHSNGLLHQGWCSTCNPLTFSSINTRTRQCCKCGRPLNSTAFSSLGDRDKCWTCEQATGIAMPLDDRKFCASNPALVSSTIIDLTTSPVERFFTAPKPAWQVPGSDLEVSRVRGLSDWRHHTLLDSSANPAAFCTKLPVERISSIGRLDHRSALISLDMTKPSRLLGGSSTIDSDLKFSLGLDRVGWPNNVCVQGMTGRDRATMTADLFPGAACSKILGDGVTGITVTSVLALSLTAKQLPEETSIAIREYGSLLPRLNETRKHCLEMLTAKSDLLTDLDVPQIWTMSRVKTISSIAAKISNRSWTEPDAWLLAKDVIGLRIVCATTEDAYRLSSFAKSSINFTDNPLQRDSLRTSESFYHAIHLHGQVGTTWGCHVQPIPIEVQIQPAFFAAQAFVIHDLFYKQPWLMENPEIRACMEEFNHQTQALQKLADKLVRIVQLQLRY